MCWHYFTWAKEVIFDPKKNTKKDFKYGEFVKRLMITSLVSGVLMTLIAALGLGIVGPEGSLLAAWAGAFFAIPLFLLSAIIGPFIGAAITHFFGKTLFRLMKKDYKKTYNAEAYSMLPRFLFAWIPLIGPIIGVVWGIIVKVYALSNQQRISTGRALLVTFLPIIILFVILFIIAAAAAVSVATILGLDKLGILDLI